MKEVWVMRHGAQEKVGEPGLWQPAAPLSEEGRRGIERIREAYLSGMEFAYCGSSPFRRAVESLAVVLPRDPLVPRGHYDRLSPVSLKVWELVIKKHPEYLSMSLHELYAQEPAQVLMLIEGERAFGCIREVTRRLADGERAFLVSHQPFIECAVAEATTEWPPKLSLQRGEIVIFRFEGEQFVSYVHLPLP